MPGGLIRSVPSRGFAKQSEKTLDSRIEDLEKDLENTCEIHSCSTFNDVIELIDVLKLGDIINVGLNSYLLESIVYTDEKITSLRLTRTVGDYSIIVSYTYADNNWTYNIEQSDLVTNTEVQGIVNDSLLEYIIPNAEPESEAEELTPLTTLKINNTIFIIDGGSQPSPSPSDSDIRIFSYDMKYDTNSLNDICSYLCNTILDKTDGWIYNYELYCTGTFTYQDMASGVIQLTGITFDGTNPSEMLKLYGHDSNSGNYFELKYKESSSEVYIDDNPDQELKQGNINITLFAYYKSNK